MNYKSWLETLQRGYRERVLTVTCEVAEVWGKLNATDPAPVTGNLLAATALLHDLTLVTRNVTAKRAPREAS